jgi:hypothetical protein
LLRSAVTQIYRGALKLKELIKMMGKQFLGEFEDHEKDESKTNEKVMKEF